MDYMNDPDVSYEYDQGTAVTTVGDVDDEDRQIESVYNRVRSDVFRNEPPPPKRIHEDCRLEAQYSEGESDDDDKPRTRDFRHITRMLRQVEPHDIDETSFLKRDPGKETSAEYAVLIKTPLNPESAEFKPSEVEPAAAPISPEVVKETSKPKKAPRCRNMAMESLARLRNLEAEMKAASKPSTMPNSPLPASDRSSSVCSEESQKQTESAREELQNPSTSDAASSPSRSANSTPKAKKSKDFVPSAKASKYYEQLTKMKKKDTDKVVDVRGQRPALNLLSGYIDVKLAEHGKSQAENESLAA